MGFLCYSAYSIHIQHVFVVSLFPFFLFPQPERNFWSTMDQASDVWTFLSKFLKFQVQLPVYLPSLHPPAYLYICSFSICCCANVVYQQLISLKQTSLHQLVHFHFYLCGSLCCISSSRNYTFTLCHTSQAHTHTQDTHTSSEAAAAVPVHPQTLCIFIYINIQ